MIKFIYFDVGSVIVDNDNARAKVSEEFNVSEEAVFGVIEKHWQAASRGTLSNTDYMDIFTKELGITHPSGNIIHFWSQYQSPIMETHAFIDEIKDEYALGLLSNAEINALGNLLKIGHIPAIDWSIIVESAQHGVIKPEEKIYEIAENLANMKPEELLFVDDRPEMIAAATKRGWHGVLFDPSDPIESVKKIKKTLKKHGKK